MPNFFGSNQSSIGSAEDASVDKTPQSSFSTEGTTVTWGQSIFIAQDNGQVASQNALTTQANQGDVPGSANAATIDLSNGFLNNNANVVLPTGGANNTLRVGGSTVTDFVTSVGLNPALHSSLIPSSPQPSVVGKNILVNLVADPKKNNVVLGSKSATSIAVAAASSNVNATAVVSPSVLGLSGIQNSLIGSSIGSLANLVPTVTGVAVVEGSQLKTLEEIREALKESAKVDLSITLRSKKSEKLEFNNLNTPILAGRFIYNYFIEEEEDINTQEDPAKDPLLNNAPYNVPRYVELVWSISEVTEPLKGTEEAVKENASFRRSVFYERKGVIGHKSLSMPFSSTKQKKNYTPYIFQGLSKKVPDIHEPERIVQLTQNRAKFNNSITVTLNISDQSSHVTDIPFESQVDA